jgi:hypothetical protein
MAVPDGTEVIIGRIRPIGPMNGLVYATTRNRIPAPRRNTPEPAPLITAAR